MKAKVDRDGCIGCGQCVGTCPEVFRIADDGHSEVYVEEIPKDAEEAAKDAAERCPAGVITVF